MLKLVEHTYGPHIYMKMQLDNHRIEEIDVFFTNDGVLYRTSADHIDNSLTAEQIQQKKELREEIIKAFKELY